MPFRLFWLMISSSVWQIVVVILHFKVFELADWFWWKFSAWETSSYFWEQHALILLYFCKVHKLSDILIKHKIAFCKANLLSDEEWDIVSTFFVFVADVFLPCSSWKKRLGKLFKVDWSAFWGFSCRAKVNLLICNLCFVGAFTSFFIYLMHLFIEG